MANKPLSIAAWSSSVLACGGFALAYFKLARYTELLSATLSGMGPALPVLVRFLIQNYTSFYLGLFMGAGALVVGKEFLLRDKGASLIITLIIALGVLFIVGCIVEILYAPFFIEGRPPS
ncbi:MAG TPA: hypothetical protein VJ723_13325 [Candidatus Angelobacter sp.]|nr:hypothetical protein [Candidatus Angelobacter sp.]